MGKQGVVLEHQPEAARSGGQLVMAWPLSRIVTLVGLLEAGDQPQGSGLAAAGWPQQGQQFPSPG
jgi:hypothetical protein